ncbi:hypothetical protein D3C75_1313440 [compost metagenome]
MRYVPAVLDQQNLRAPASQLTDSMGVVLRAILIQFAMDHERRAVDSLDLAF